MVLANIEPNVLTGQAPSSVANGRCVGRECGFVDTQLRIAQAVRYMRECLNQSLQVPALARMANISPSHFFAVFKRQTGFAPLDFFIRLRMQRACEIFDATVFSVKEVAGKLGYDDPFYFSRVFKSVSGFAPTEYRRLSETQKQLCRQRLWGDAGSWANGRSSMSANQESK